MSGYTNISNPKSPRPIWSRLLILAVAGLASVSLAGAASLANPTAKDADPAHETLASPGAVNAQSATIPGHDTRAVSLEAIPATALASAPRPLTRAATQLQIDEMSPVGWLRQFGAVSIGRRP